MQAKGFEMIGRAVAFVGSQIVLRIGSVQLLDELVARHFCQDGGRGDGDGAGVAVDERFLREGKVEFDGVEEEIVGRNGELGDGQSHGLAAGLENVPGVDAGGFHLGNSPGYGTFADEWSELSATFGREFFRIIEAANDAPGVENGRSGNYGAEQSAATGFVEAGDAEPAGLARQTFETRGTEAAHHREV